MSYAGEAGEVSAVYRSVTAVPGLVRPTSSVQFVAPGSVTRSEFGLFLWEMKAKAGGPDPHFHRTFSESFYVLGGTVRLYDGEDWLVAGPGDFLYVPKGGIHAFNNSDSDEPASMLILFAPGPPRERYFQELAEIGESGRQLTHEEWTELYARHDQYMVRS